MGEVICICVNNWLKMWTTSLNRRRFACFADETIYRSSDNFTFAKDGRLRYDSVTSLRLSPPDLHLDNQDFLTTVQATILSNIFQDKSTAGLSLDRFGDKINECREFPRTDIFHTNDVSLPYICSRMFTLPKQKKIM